VHTLALTQLLNSVPHLAARLRCCSFTGIASGGSSALLMNHRCGWRLLPLAGSHLAEWRLVDGCWLAAGGRLAAGSRRLAAGGWCSWCSRASSHASLTSVAHPPPSQLPQPPQPLFLCRRQADVAAAFASGAFNVMAATDVAAEGMDFRACSLVVALQPPAGARCARPVLRLGPAGPRLAGWRDLGWPWRCMRPQPGAYIRLRCPPFVQAGLSGWPGARCPARAPQAVRAEPRPRPRPRGALRDHVAARRPGPGGRLPVGRRGGQPSLADWLGWLVALYGAVCRWVGAGAR
jgi:hypothetical protein